MNIPNILTSLRLLLIPVIVVVHYLPFTGTNGLAAGIFLVASFTDWFDGYLARRLNQTTPFGAFLDPVADKVMVAVALVLLIEKFDTPIITIPGMIIISREIVISALREWMAELGKRTSVAVSFIGKLKTASQMGSITLLLWAEHMSEGLVGISGLMMLQVAAVLTIWSMFIYLKAAWPDLNPFGKE